MKLSVCKEFVFDAAHRLPNYNGPCERLHGHQWKLEIEVSGEVSQDTGMVLDFVHLKKVVNMAIIDKLDHQYINDIYQNPTAENMVISFVEQMKELVGAGYGLTLERIRLYETPTSFAEWRRDNQ